MKLSEIRHRRIIGVYKEAFGWTREEVVARISFLPHSHLGWDTLMRRKIIKPNG